MEEGDGRNLHDAHNPDDPQEPSTNPDDLLNKQMQRLTEFWKAQLSGVENVHSFRRHALPLARIKKIMKTDDEVKMISSEVPILFSKMCEIFILELTLRSWMLTEECKRRTLQKHDVAVAVGKCDTYDFLIDIVPRDDDASLDHARPAPLIQPNNEDLRNLIAHPELQQYYYQVAHLRDTSGAHPDSRHMDPTHQLMMYQQQQHSYRLMQQQMMGYASPSLHGSTSAMDGSLPVGAEEYMEGHHHHHPPPHPSAHPHSPHLGGDPPAHGVALPPISSTPDTLPVSHHPMPYPAHGGGADSSSGMVRASRDQPVSHFRPGISTLPPISSMRGGTGNPLRSPMIPSPSGEYVPHREFPSDDVVSGGGSHPSLLSDPGRSAPLSGGVAGLLSMDERGTATKATRAGSAPETHH